jgi:polyisoprenoid-binding protein YceI
MSIRFTINAKSVNIESANTREVEVTLDIDDSEIQNILENIDLKEIYNHLEGADVLNANLFLKYCTLEDVFEHFNPVELKTRLAQYLIDE